MIDQKTRLNATLRQTILDKALETSGITEAKKSLIDRRAALAEKVRQMCLAACGTSDAALTEQYAQFSAFERGNRDSMDNSTGKFISLSLSRDTGGNTYFDVNVAGQVRRFWMNGAENAHVETHLNIPRVSDGGPWVPYWRVTLPAVTIADEADKLATEQSMLNERETVLVKTVSAVLKSVTTVKRLLEAWPAAAELLPESPAPVTTGTGLAISPDDLNALCGIPKGE